MKVGIVKLEFLATRWRKPIDPMSMCLHMVSVCDRQTDGRTNSTAYA